MHAILWLIWNWGKKARQVFTDKSDEKNCCTKKTILYSKPWDPSVFASRFHVSINGRFLSHQAVGAKRTPLVTEWRETSTSCIITALNGDNKCSEERRNEWTLAELTDSNSKKYLLWCFPALDTQAKVIELKVKKSFTKNCFGNISLSMAMLNYSITNIAGVGLHGLILFKALIKQCWFVISRLLMVPVLWLGKWYLKRSGRLKTAKYQFVYADLITDTCSTQMREKSVIFILQIRSIFRDRVVE